MAAVSVKILGWCLFLCLSRSGLEMYLSSDAHPQYCAGFLDLILHFFVQNTLMNVSFLRLMMEPELCVDVIALSWGH